MLSKVFVSSAPIPCALRPCVPLFRLGSFPKSRLNNEYILTFSNTTYQPKRNFVFVKPQSVGQSKTTQEPIFDKELKVQVAFHRISNVKPGQIDITELITKFDNKLIQHDNIEKIFKSLEKEDILAWKFPIGKIVLLLQRLAQLRIDNSNHLIEQRIQMAKKLTDCCLQRFQNMRRMDVIMLLWSSVKIGIYNDLILKKCLNFISDNLDDLYELDFSNYLFSLARIVENSQTPENITKIIDNHLAKQRENLVPKLRNILSTSGNQQHITNIIWAIDRLGFRDPSLLLDCEKTFMMRSIPFNNANFGIIVNSFSHMQHTPKDLFEYTLLAFYNRIGTLDRKEFISIVRALYIPNVLNLFVFLKKIEPFIEKNIKKFTVEDLLTLLIPFAVGQVRSAVSEQILSQIQASLNQIKTPDMCKFLWCLALLGVQTKIDFSILIPKHFNDSKIKELRFVDVNQAAQGLLSLILLTKDKTDVNPIIKETYDKMKDIITNNILINRHETFVERTSSFDVQAILKGLGLQVVPEAIIEIYSIDLALINITKETILNLQEELKQKIGTSEKVKVEESPQENHFSVLDIQKDKLNTLLIEINGPVHYVGNTKKIKGPTVLKKQHLMKMGYNLISISIMECVEIAKLESEAEKGLALIKLILKEYK